VVWVDPFLTGNPKAAVSLAAVDRADVVVITHDHGDHRGDGFALCRKTGATLVALYEIAVAAGEAGLGNEPMNIGGTVAVGPVRISLVPAFHSAGLGGTASGAIIELDGKTIYHAGDTGLTMEMALIGEMYRPDIAFLPIDGRFNMTPRLAAKAAELLGVPWVVPIHYDTFPAIMQPPEEFARLLPANCRCSIPSPGEGIEF
jgi:L-ascorbate metabolism protein UlaG (beta-lactamase superfamily)